MAALCCDPAGLAPETISQFYAPTAVAGDGLTTVLGRMVADADDWTNLPALAYALATFKWETAHTFQPVHELGSLSYFDKYEPGTQLGQTLGNTCAGDGFLFRGRGYVQITGRANYHHIGQLLGMDLISNPDMALDPAIAYKIAAGGMKNGWFTGRRLSQYFADGVQPDYINARRMINVLDHAQDIATIAQQFVMLLTPAPAAAAVLASV